MDFMPKLRGRIHWQSDIFVLYATRSLETGVFARPAENGLKNRLFIPGVHFPMKKKRMFWLPPSVQKDAARNGKCR